jgi:hypothetical protein
MLERLRWQQVAFSTSKMPRLRVMLFCSGMLSIFSKYFFRYFLVKAADPSFLNRIFAAFIMHSAGMIAQGSFAYVVGGYLQVP